MQVVTLYSIRPLHWWIALSIALLLHLIFMLNFSPELQKSASTNTSTELVIGLKKLKSPQPVKEESLPTVEPVPSPVNKPVPVSKKKLAPQKPKIVKPKVIPRIVKPKVVPLAEQGEVPAEQLSQPVATAPAPSAQSESIAAHNPQLAEIKTDYLARLAVWLDRHKRYPREARRRGQEGEITVRFSINDEGNLLSYELIEPSSYVALNNAVVKMLTSASPMPAVPPELRGGQTSFEYSIPVVFKLK